MKKSNFFPVYLLLFLSLTLSGCSSSSTSPALSSKSDQNPDIKIQTMVQELVEIDQLKKSSETKIVLSPIRHRQTGVRWKISSKIESIIAETLQTNDRFILFEQNQSESLRKARKNLLSGTKITHPDFLISGNYELSDEKRLHVTLKLIRINNGEILSNSKTDLKRSGVVLLLEPEEQSISFVALQDLIAKQNREMESVRKRSDDLRKKQRFIEILREQRRAMKQFGTVHGEFSARKYDENVAFVDIKTTPGNQSLYIGDRWIGKAPIKKMELEAGATHEIVVRGDPRYFLPVTIRKQYKKYERAFETISLKRGKAKLILVGDHPIRRVFVNQCEYHGDFSMIEVSTGKNQIEIYDTVGYASMVVDSWVGDTLRVDITRESYSRSPLVRNSKINRSLTEVACEGPLE